MANEAAADGSAFRLEREGAVAWIIADNPERMNAVTASMWAALPGLVADAEADDGIRVVVLRGAGTRAFSAGADISEFETARAGDGVRDYDRLNHAAFTALTEARKPTIAMIHGFCLGGGFAIAACCDLRLADTKSQFALPPAKLGLGYNPRWVRTLLSVAAPAYVREMLFTGRRVDADEAARMGLVNRVVAEEALEETTRALATEIAANAPLTIRAAKGCIAELIRHPENPDLAALDAEVAACFASRDYAEGRAAFLEKRKPRFEGR